MGGSFDSSKNARIAELEKLVQEYHTKLEASIATLANQNSPSNSLEATASVKLLQSMADDHTATFNQLSHEKRKLFESKSTWTVGANTEGFLLELLTFFLPQQPRICSRSRTRDCVQNVPHWKPKWRNTRLPLVQAPLTQSHLVFWRSRTAQRPDTRRCANICWTR